jgi:hypothetical protein
MMGAVPRTWSTRSSSSGSRNSKQQQQPAMAADRIHAAGMDLRGYQLGKETRLTFFLMCSTGKSEGL